jgi:hypothetical protein
LFTPIFIWCLTWLTNRLELYRQLSNSVTHYENFNNLHSTIYTIASSITDLNSYRQDIEQFKFIHKFDLQHRLSVSTIEENEQKISQSDSKIGQNNNSFNNRPYKSLPDLHPKSRIWRNRQVKKVRKRQSL